MNFNFSDEELARRLQEEENKHRSARPRPHIDLPSTRPRPTPIVGMSFDLPDRRAPAAWKYRTGNQSLIDIMREEQRHQDDQKEIVS